MENNVHKFPISLRHVIRRLYFTARNMEHSNPQQANKLYKEVVHLMLQEAAISDKTVRSLLRSLSKF
jgi:hypothetical protein